GSPKSCIKSEAAAASSPSPATAATVTSHPSNGKSATSGKPMPIHWTQGNVAIPESVLDVVEEAARAAYARNEEACGYLEGPAAEPLHVDRAIELENLDDK